MVPVVAVVVGVEGEAGEVVAAGAGEGAVSTAADTAVGEEEDTEEEGATGGKPRRPIAAIRLILYIWSRFGPVL